MFSTLDYINALKNSHSVTFCDLLAIKINELMRIYSLKSRIFIFFSTYKTKKQLTFYVFSLIISIAMELH